MDWKTDYFPFLDLIGLPKEKYDPKDLRRIYAIMSLEEAANGKKSQWAELEISGELLWICQKLLVSPRGVHEFIERMHAIL